MAIVGDKLRIGAVRYLNSKPLIECLPEMLPEAQITVDFPSRLADGLAAGRFDVALIPSIETLRLPGARVVSNVCVSCDGPVRSVKMVGRVAPQEIATLALDEGSRTSAALARILLKERFGIEPSLQPLGLGSLAENSPADAVVVIGDRAMLPLGGPYEFVWDLGDEWRAWTGLPFVFAMWTAWPAAEIAGLGSPLGSARDRGLTRLGQIARRSSAELGLAEAECLEYLRDALVFHLGPRQRQGLERFADLAIGHGLAPEDSRLEFAD